MMVVLVWVLQRNRANRIRIDLEKDIYSEGLAHAEAGKSHCLLSASWRPRKVCGVDPVQAPRPKNQGT